MTKMGRPQSRAVAGLLSRHILPTLSPISLPLLLLMVLLCSSLALHIDLCAAQSRASAFAEVSSVPAASSGKVASDENPTAEQSVEGGAAVPETIASGGLREDGNFLSQQVEGIVSSSSSSRRDGRIHRRVAAVATPQSSSTKSPPKSPPPRKSPPPKRSPPPPKKASPPPPLRKSPPPKATSSPPPKKSPPLAKPPPVKPPSAKPPPIKPPALRPPSANPSPPKSSPPRRPPPGRSPPKKSPPPVYRLPPGFAPPSSVNGRVTSALFNAGHTRTAQRIQATGLVLTLTSQIALGNTFLAPTNAAYAGIPANVRALINDPVNGIDYESSLLQYQVIADRYTAANLRQEAPSSYETLLQFHPINSSLVPSSSSPGGKAIEFSPIPSRGMKKARVVREDLYVDSTIAVHVIDQFLIPPMDLLLPFFEIPGEPPAPAPAPEPAAPPPLVLPPVGPPDSPKARLVTTLFNAGHTAIARQLVATGLADVLTPTPPPSQPLTLFAPTDDAFANIPDSLAELFLGTPEDSAAVMSRLLHYHVSSSKIDAVALQSGTRSSPATWRTLLEGESFRTVNAFGVVSILPSGGDAVSVSQVEFYIDNSHVIVHVVDRIMVPNLSSLSAPPADQ